MLVILVLAALFGVRILHLFGVSLDAFSVAGGGVLSWIGFSMLAGNAATDKPANDGDARWLAPLIIFAASTGTITGVITLALPHGHREPLPVTALTAVAMALLAMWIAMLLVARMGGRAGGGGFLRETIVRFMGLIRWQRIGPGNVCPAPTGIRSAPQRTVPASPIDALRWWRSPGV